MEFPVLPQAKDKIISFLSEKIAVSPSQIHVVASPYRICPLGAHIDHQGGPVLGMTIDAYTLLAFVPSDNTRIDLTSINYEGDVSFDLNRVPESIGNHWGNYVRSAVLALQETHILKKGIVGVIDGMLPGCGLSSSASVLLAYLHALSSVNDIPLQPWDFVRLTRKAENRYMGLNNGILDQTSIVFGIKDNLIHIDTIKEAVTHFPAPPTWSDYLILVAYSGYSRELTTSGFNSRVQECREAAKALADMVDLDSPKRLSDIPEDVFHRYNNKLPSHLARRANHFFGEVKRVHHGVDAWKKGQMDRFGRLMLESYDSSVRFYECGIQALYDLQDIVCSVDGIIGSRFMGGGFGGCVVGFIRKDQASSAVDHIGTVYKRLHPEVADKAAVYLTRSADGIRPI